MPGYKTIVVDTQRMADSIDRVTDGVQTTSDTLQGTTVAVVAMSNEVCRAEEQAARQVSQKVSSGFHGLISVQIAQKKVMSFSEVSSKSQLLAHFNRRLGMIRKQLHGDFLRITKRYAKILGSLNDALKNRVHNLDAPAMDVAENSFQTMLNRVFATGVPTVLLDQDIQQLRSMIMLAKCKDDCTRTVYESKNIIADIRKLRSDMAECLREVPLQNSRRYLMPVVLIEKSDLNMADLKNVSIEAGSLPEQTRLYKKINASVENNGDQLVWQNSEQTVSLVRNKILKIASDANLDARTGEVLRGLLEKSSWQVLEGAK